MLERAPSPTLDPQLPASPVSFQTPSLGLELRVPDSWSDPCLTVWLTWRSLVSGNRSWWGPFCTCHGQWHHNLLNPLTSWLWKLPVLWGSMDGGATQDTFEDPWECHSGIITRCSLQSNEPVTGLQSDTRHFQIPAHLTLSTIF
jgi:hypothetical protein